MGRDKVSFIAAFLTVAQERELYAGREVQWTQRLTRSRALDNPWEESYVAASLG